VKALQITRKFLREISREPSLLALIVLIPLAFLGITAFAYSEPYQKTYDLWVSIGDGGDRGLIEAIAAARYPDGPPVFDVKTVADDQEANAALEARQIVAFLEIDINDDGQLETTVNGDALNTRFYRASVILDDLLFQHADRIAGRTTPVEIVEKRYAPSGPSNEFDYYAPGMIVFALLMLIPQTAMLVGRESRWGTLRRLRLSRVRAWELLLGISLAQLVVAVILVLVLLLVAIALGYHNNGSPLLATIVSLAISLSAIGIGLVVGCFVENDSQAVNRGSSATMLGVFISGAFFPMTSTTLFTFLGHPITLFDFFPATHGLLALQQVLNDGATFANIAFRLGLTLLLSLLYFMLGVIFFSRWKLRGENIPLQ
jgi:ABC-2 type transport system permease protein